ncbi:MAG: SUMF1/EgtB/PvdO family nonheme iron enzyme [Candidatus Tectomicrobia bacterium]|uniref:SUMF1/EgtB/PvdO family nonheme iron enzyme n=1 Tax=Tectimicrobiota bacterium TaxID=2528274 RepID=A0A932FW95_UNCTE|nr:SUMF1/EgtB/PvdO family nonheme iron enzyme [Candidatus Tectomicrobia bacterium]
MLAILAAIGWAIGLGSPLGVAADGPGDPSPTAPPGMVFIPVGPFIMGDTEHKDEEPVHEVSLDGFYIDRHEVTNLDYERDHPDHARNPFSACDRCPVTMVSWQEAHAYCQQLGKRLPTEAEWEKAARGPQGYRYDYGNDYDPTQARVGMALEDGAIEVGGFLPNGYGLYDTSGNAWEWVADWYDDHYYHHSPTVNPQGPDQGIFRGFRGGSWNVDVCYSRVSNRDGGLPDARYPFIGFRCAQSTP